MEDNREAIDAGTSWGLLLVILTKLGACLSVAIEIAARS